MALPTFSHLRAGDLAIMRHSQQDVPVKVAKIHDGNALTVHATAARDRIEKGDEFLLTDNLTQQNVVTRTKSRTTLLVF